MVCLHCSFPLGFQANGLKEGDYIVSVGDTDCKWMAIGEVMALLKDVDEEEGVNIRVVSMMESYPNMVRQFTLQAF